MEAKWLGALLLEGIASDLAGSGMRWEAIQGALITVALFIGLPVLRSRNPEETLLTFVYAARQRRASVGSAFNQGIRYLLLRALIDTGENDEAWEWIGRYDGEASAAWLYPKALLAFRQIGRTERVDKLLREAIQYNPFVPDYLLSTRKLPKRLPDYVGLGDREEAVAYAAECKGMWEQTPGALEWLRGIGRPAV